MELLLAFGLGMALEWYIAPVVDVECKASEQVVAACPPLTKITDKTFGGHVYQLQIDSGQYMECRKACVQGK